MASCAVPDPRERGVLGGRVGLAAGGAGAGVSCLTRAPAALEEN